MLLLYCGAVYHGVADFYGQDIGQNGFINNKA